MTLKNLEACEYLGVNAMWLGRNRRGLNIGVIPCRKTAGSNRWYYEYKKTDLDNAREQVEIWKRQAKANRRYGHLKAKDKPRDTRAQNLQLAKGHVCEIINCNWDDCEMKAYRGCK